MGRAQPTGWGLGVRKGRTSPRGLHHQGASASPLSPLRPGVGASPSGASAGAVLREPRPPARGPEVGGQTRVRGDRSFLPRGTATCSVLTFPYSKSQAFLVANDRACDLLAHRE